MLEAVRTGNAQELGVNTPLLALRVAAVSSASSAQLLTRKERADVVCPNVRSIFGRTPAVGRMQRFGPETSNHSGDPDRREWVLRPLHLAKLTAVRSSIFRPATA